MEASFFNDQIHQKKIFLKRLGEIYLYDYNIVKNEIAISSLKIFR